MANGIHSRIWRCLLLVACVVGTVGVAIVQANTPQPPMHLGRIWHNPEYDGAEGWAGSLLQYPHGIKAAGDNPGNYIKRQWLGQCHKGGTYLWTINWTDPESVPWEYASSYFFRSMNYLYPLKYTSVSAQGNMNYLYPGGVQEYYRWERPTIKVYTAEGPQIPYFFPDTGTVTYPDNGGVGKRPTPIVVPDLVSEQAIYMWWRHIQGVELRRMEYGYPTSTPHQDYILQDIRLVNNGISGVTDDAPVLTNQTINKMVWAQNFDYRNEAAPGVSVGKDTEAEYIQPWGDPGHGAVMFWDIDSDDATRPGPDWGDPAEAAAYENLLVGNCYALYGALFASAGPAGNFAVDDPIQPAFRTIWWERGFDFAAKDYSPPNPPDGLDDQRSFMVDGLLQIPYNQGYRDFGPCAGIKNDGAGPTSIMGYGPVVGTPSTTNINDHGWDLAWLDSVRIVQVMAAGGIDKEESRRIGLAWNTALTAPTPPDPSTWMSAADIALVQSGRDTALKAAAMAYFNFNGAMPGNVTGTELAAWGIPNHVTTKPSQYNQPYNVPEAPRPPGYISVKGTATGIEIRWTKEAETTPDFDTGVADFAGYRLYRQQGSMNAPMVLVASGPASNFTDAPAAGDEPAGRLYVDAVTPLVYHWYTVVAYDDGVQNWADPGKSLTSSLWWNWTGYWLTGVQASGTDDVKERARPNAFALEQNAPNPFNPSTVIRFSVPASEKVSLAIYDVNGRLVRTLLDGTVNGGVHEVTWDGTDLAGRTVASGLYIYRLVGEHKQITRKMTLVR